MLWLIFYLFCLVLLAKVSLWFLDPYFVYKRRTLNKDIEYWVRGTKVTKQSIGTPYLLE